MPNQLIFRSFCSLVLIDKTFYSCVLSYLYSTNSSGVKPDQQCKVKHKTNWKVDQTAEKGEYNVQNFG